MNTAQNLFGKQLIIPKIDAGELHEILKPLLMYYADRDRGIIRNRVTECIVKRQRYPEQ